MAAQTAAQLAAQNGLTEAEVQAEMTKNPTLNPDVVVGGLLTQKANAAAGMKPMAALAAPAPAPAAPVAAPAPAPSNVTPTGSPVAAPAAPAAPPASATPAKAANTYTVASGDNLTSIAKRYGTTVSAILAANPNIKDPNMILAGSSLALPPAAPVAAAPFQMPAGYEAIDGSRYGTSELQKANYTDIKADPTGTFLYGKKTSIADTVNASMTESFGTAEAAKDAASSTQRYSAQADALQKKINDSLGVKADEPTNPSTVTASDGQTIPVASDPTALELYKSLMQSPDILASTKAMADKKAELDKLNASEAAFANDILKEVQGEAPQSYIDALVAERSKDIYPKKLALTAEYNSLVAQNTALKENAANILQFTLKDQETRYNRMFQNLQLLTQKEQFAQGQENWQKTFNETQYRNDLQHETQVLGILKDLPSNRSVTINGTLYKGMSEDANLNVIQFTDANRNVVVTAVDKVTGEIKYKKIVGKAPAPVGSTGASREITFTDKDGKTWLKGYNKEGKEVYSTLVGEGQKSVVSESDKLKEERAKAQNAIDKGIADGTYAEITDDKGSYVIDKKKYEQALTDWNTGGSWLASDSDATFEGKSYRGPTDSMPNPLDFKIYSPK